MPSPSKQQQNVTTNVSGDSGPTAEAVNSQDSGIIDPRTLQLSDAPGAASTAPQGLSRQEVFALLTQAVEAHDTAQGALVAAGAAARMRQLDSSFTQDSSGYKTFRLLLEDAQRSGIVKLVQPPGASDVAIFSAASDVTPLVVSTRRQAQRLRSDLWRAFVNWDQTVAYRFDRQSGLLTSKDDDSASADSVDVPSVSKESQIDWMKEFAMSEKDDEVRAALAEGLGHTDPVRGFSEVAKAHAAVGRRWKRFLKKRVLDRATNWALSNGIALSDIETGSIESETEPASEYRAAQSGAEDIRGEILAILALLPTSELLRIPIPVEYALKR